tara:strand:- start:2405 stop:2968 length:564 start_codon:yes stop_codon:yes gene_type:complete
MKLFYPYLLVVGAMSLFLLTTVQYENQIDGLNDELQDNYNTNDSLNSIIDSLKSEIDTLEWDSDYWDFDIKFNGKSILSSIMFVESSYNDLAYNSREDAVGCLQIRQCMVDDINRILRRKGSYHTYTMNDRWDRDKSIEMFTIYCDHYNLNTAEAVARCWNGGPRGIDNPATVGYWNKVKNNIKENS